MLFDAELFVLGDTTVAGPQLQALRGSGFRVTALSDSTELIGRGRPKDAFTPVLLTGPVASLRQTVVGILSQYPRVCLVAIAQTTHEDEHLSWLSLGVDWICRSGDSSQLLAAVLLARWRRHLGEVPGAGQQAYGGWILREYAWTLEGPNGGRIGLTAGERALLATLFSAPGLSARHAALRAALEDAYAYQAGASGRPPARLGVVINRLRAKGRRAGLEIPIRAVRGHGYTLMAPQLSDTD